MKTKNSIALIVVILIAFGFFYGDRLFTFVPTDISISSTEGVTNFGDYKIVNQIVNQFETYSFFSCKDNSCGGTETSRDKLGCPVFSADFTKIDIACSSTEVLGYRCAPGGCGYYALPCNFDSYKCNSLKDISYSCKNGKFTGDSCRGQTDEVKYIATANCIKNNVVCGGYSLGSSNLKKGCGSQHEIYYKGKLIKKIVGSPLASGQVTSVQDAYFLNGIEVSDSRNAEIIMRLHMFDNYISSPSECVSVTNEFDIPTSEDSFDTSVSLDNSDLKISFKNNYGKNVYGNAVITYSLDTVLGKVTKEQIEFLNLDKDGDFAIIKVPEDVLKENIHLDITLDILVPTADYSGFELSDNKCFRNGEIGKGGKLVDIENCQYLKIGSDSESFDIEGEEVNSSPSSPLPNSPGIISILKDNYLIGIIILLISIGIYILKKRKT